MVRPVDPTSSLAEQNRILSRLSQPWGSSFSCSNLQQFASQLNRLVPVTLNERSLEEIGIHSTIEVEFRIKANETPIGTLDRVLSDLDLTWTLRGGRCTLETVEAAEQSLTIKIYDVTPLVIDGRLSHLPMRQQTDFTSLEELIATTIMPDTWERLGGPSSFARFIVKDRCLLVIASTTHVQLKTELLLNQLNRFGTACPNRARPKRVEETSSRLPKFGARVTSPNR